MYGMLDDGDFIHQHVTINASVPPETIAVEAIPTADERVDVVQPGTEFPLASASYVKRVYRYAGMRGTPNPVAIYLEAPEAKTSDDASLLADESLMM